MHPSRVAGAGGVLVVAAVPRYTRWGPLTIISAVRVRQQPLTHWSMPTHAASLSPFLLPPTPLWSPTPRSSRVSLQPRCLALSRHVSLCSPLSPSLILRLVGPLSPSPRSLFIALSPTGPRKPSPSLSAVLFPPEGVDPFAVWLACV